MDSVKQEGIKNMVLNKRFFSILEDFVNEYKIAKSHPDIIEYSDKLLHTEDEYKKLEKDMFLQKNHLEKLVIQMNTRIRTQSKNIEEYRTSVDKLKKKSSYLKPIVNSSQGLYEEEKQLYSMIHYEIIALIMGVFMASGLTYATFRKT